MERLQPTVAILVAILAIGTRPQYCRATDQPNVLLICVDDLNDWVGCLGGHPQVKTPHIDALSKRGLLFRNAHCQSPLCNPSRTSFLTGMRPSTTGVYALEPWFRTVPAYRDHVTMPQAFAAAGYSTLSTGKIFHDAYPPTEERKDGSEFSVWGYFGSHGPRPDRKFVQTPSPIPLMDWGPFPERDELQEDAKVADWAVARLHDLPAEQPFFLCVGFRRPHVPCYAPPKWFDLYPEEALTLPHVLASDRDDTPRFSWYLHWKLPEPRHQWLVDSGQWKPLVRAYLASISFMDAQVGRVLEALRSSGRDDSTIVVFFSDHGWHLGEKAISGKNSLWDRSTRVPMIIAGPGVMQGSICLQPAELLDLYPTLLELCGLPARPELEGHSLTPQLVDPQARRAWPAITTHGPGNHAVRTDRWRLIRYADGSTELYDMQADPDEWTNLAGRAEHVAIEAKLAACLPASSARPATGSKSRLVQLEDGTVYWEGQPINPDAPIPID